MIRVFIFEPSSEREALLNKQLKGSNVRYQLFKEFDELQAALEENAHRLVLLDVDFLKEDLLEILPNLSIQFPQSTLIGFSAKPKHQLWPIILQHKIFVIPLGEKLIFDLPALISQYAQQAIETPEETAPDKEIRFIGQSKSIQDILHKIEYIAVSDIHVLITGETGSGKTVLAKLIHQKSARKRYPFFHINCAAIPDQLLEAELFGFKKGAFTGAVRDTPGKFKAAGKGTILLDEIGEMPVHLQAKILRVLDEGLYFPVGAVKTEKVSARIIAATNKNIEEEIANKKFRKDLYYRLNTIEIHIPPLRQRKEDISQLFDFYLDNYVKKYNIKKPAVQPNVYEVLKQYHWPGNIRELQNVVETIMYMKPQQITLSMLPQKIFNKMSATLIKAGSEHWTLEELKREYARYIYNLTGKNKAKSARVLGVDIKTFRKLINQV
ncbi:sigma-54 interaction domain-containing protein [Caldithrix abyssi]|uniref:Sigma 54 interacting domain protein n=1 Tax=Caldithrix abyssi DSM 13497 TaxID=880073 RepID=H1XSV1_CALAY|nr:sigma-54 dependent transcriptional regulator [Caldithrix abyssi]APF20278.1 Sigma-54 interaction domain-containing protein [Caldithrix abyssi DSM 13497]EHO40328.1 Sigma 54 interacting domain protein [Caldithrix abyssi DSM 13497]